MSLLEPRCLVCGAPLDQGAPFERDVRKSEVCSDECCERYMHDEDEGTPFGSINIGAEMAATMGEDPRPYLTDEQIQEQLRISRMTREEWDAEWERRLGSPF